MQHRTRNVLTAVLASCLLAAVGFSGTVAARDPNGGHPGNPGTSAKPLPSGWAWPSDLKTQKPHDPQKTEKPEKPDKPDKPDKAEKHDPDKTNKPILSCTPTSGSSATPAPSAASSAVSGTAAVLLNGKLPGFKGDWDKLATDLRGRFNAEWLNNFCQIDPLRAALDKQIAGRISSLQELIDKVGKSGLGASDQATVDGELNSLIADLKALKTKVDAETTLAALQADFQTLNSKSHLYRSVTQWVQLLVGAEKLIASEPDLATLQSKVAAEVAAAPAGPETADAQIYLNDLKLALADGTSLVAPLPAKLLAITPAQLADGSADAVLAAAKVTLFHAAWDFQLARWAGHWAENEIKEATATPKSTPVATPTATPAATATPVATPTATPV